MVGDRSWHGNWKSTVEIGGMKDNISSKAIWFDMRAELQRLKRDSKTGPAIAAASGSMAAVQEISEQVAIAQPTQASGSVPAVAVWSSSQAAKAADVAVAKKASVSKIAVSSVAVLRPVFEGRFQEFAGLKGLINSLTLFLELRSGSRVIFKSRCRHWSPLFAALMG
jgi:hypothetical protein